MKSLSLSVAFALTSLTFLGVLGSPLGIDNAVCPGGVILAETFIGADKNVKVEYMSCSVTSPVQARAPNLTTRQTNVCGAQCNTNCFTPSGGGPDPNDCTVIADALLYDSQNTGALFEIGTGTNNTIAMTYSTCTSFFVNQDLGSLTYCRSDWAAVIDFVAPNCQSTQNAHGGNCVASNQEWFIQVQHS